MNPEDKIKELINKSYAKTTAGVDNRILAGAWEHLEKIRERNLVAGGAGIRRIIVKSPIAKLAAAAVIIIAAFLGIHQFFGSTVAWADVLTFIYPLWWAGPPAIAKGYLDRVFSAGFAYSFGPGGLQRLLTDKQVATIVTIGDTEENYTEKGIFEALDRLMDEVTFDFSGIQPVWHKYFGSVPLVTDDDRRKMLEEVRELARGFGGS